MSLILDALRKSERTRQQTLTGQVSVTGDASQHARIPVPWATLIGILLVVNAVVLVTILLRTHASRSAPAAETRMTVKTSPAAPAIPVYHPEIRSLAAEAAAISTGGTAITRAESGTASAAGTGISSVAATPTKTPESVSAPTAAASAFVNGRSVASAPPLDSLPAAFQQSLPPLHLDVHAYARNPANRFVIINMQHYRIGDTLKEGPKVIDIVPQGVILAYKGQTFLLPRL